MAQNQDGKSYKDTLNLPRTEFPIRANPKEDDKLMLERWGKEDLYHASFIAHEGKQKFILHDGPPYANGNIHLGHALNKILKDIVGKSQRMFGKQVSITPGWDCHGLPIELKVTQEHPGLNRTDLKKACRAYAQKWIDVQREEFKQLGVLMDWQDPYLTMDYSYEASILKAFGVFIEKGYIERSNKTVPWCSSCQTVLASAEIEYSDRKDPSVYTLFSLTQKAIQSIVPVLHDKEVNLVVWTTTPWTLPLNRAVLLKPDADYVVLEVDGRYLVTAERLADQIVRLTSATKKIVATFNTKVLTSGTLYAKHPFIDDLEVPIILDQSVSLEDGSAVVHCAPGCGPEDYGVGIKNRLEIYSPITNDGLYTQEVKPAALAGIPVAEGQWWVLRRLQELGKLYYKGTITHSYPHCWRCNQGLIFRATKQWFCDLSKHNLKKRTLDAIDAKVKTIPEKSINRLKATLEGRLEWCLSRQRVWGVPIPAIIHDKTDYVYTSREFVDEVAKHIAKEGIEWWDSASIADLLPKDFDFKRYPLDELRKEQDILDVWFESGVSFYAVLLQRNQLAFPADIYLEGSDQHRAWFQSSLLISMVLEDEPAMKLIMTHGFTVDEKGRKMSKSIGNVIAPQDMIKELGTDGLRLWVSSIDTSGDAVVSQTLMVNVKEVYRKIRNTGRFLLSNFYDFDIQKDAIRVSDLMMIDAYALKKIYLFNQEVLKAYQGMDFNKIFHMLADYSAVELSAFYLDIIKDRLYVEQADGLKRRSAQTVCWYILDTLTRLMAPILSFTAEQLSDYYQENKQKSIHLQEFSDLHLAAYSANGEHEKLWDQLKQVRSAILKAIEQLREQGTIKHSLEARVSIYVDNDQSAFNWLEKCYEQLGKQNIEDFFKEFLIVSQFELNSDKQGFEKTSLSGLYVLIEQAKGKKCARCWQWQKDHDMQDLCERCLDIIHHG
jgi:isoleucyl-tRNA synthetase